MKGTVNVPRTVQDPTYRYKMPIMQLKIESKGNGIKTNIVNLNLIAKSLNVPTEYPLKYLSFINGVQSNYKKTGKEERCIIQGAFKQKELENGLDEFIDKYILCPKCTFPELNMTIKKSKIFGKCRSCGTQSQLDSVHNMASYILKHPPQSTITNFKQQEKEDGYKQDKLQQDQKDEGEQQERLRRRHLTEEKQQQILNETNEFLLLQLDENNKLKNEDNAQQQYYIRKGAEDIIGYLIFQSCFGIKNEQNQYLHNPRQAQKLFIGIIKYLFEYLVEKNYQMQILINFSYFIYVTRKDENLDKFIPTIIKDIYEDDIIDHDLILEWADGEWSEKFESHYLYQQIADQKLISASQKAIQYIKDDLENEEEDDEQDDE